MSYLSRLKKLEISRFVSIAFSAVLILGLSLPQQALAYTFSNTGNIPSVSPDTEDEFNGILDSKFEVTPSNNSFPGFGADKDSQGNIALNSAFYLTAGQSITLKPARGTICWVSFRSDANSLVRVSGNNPTNSPGGGDQEYIAAGNPRSYYPLYLDNSHFADGYADPEAKIEVLYGQAEIVDIHYSAAYNSEVEPSVSVSSQSCEKLDEFPLELNCTYAKIKAGESLNLSIVQNSLPEIFQKLSNPPSNCYGEWYLNEPAIISDNVDNPITELYDGNVSINEYGELWIDPAILDDQDAVEQLTNNGLLVSYGWTYDGKYAKHNPVCSRECLVFLDPELADNPEKPTEILAANNNLAQLAASALAGFDLSDFHLNVPVSVNVESSAFEDQDTTIWTDSDAKYSEFFKSVLSGYTVVDRENSGTSKYIALKNDKTGDIILAFDPDDLLSNIKVAYDALDLPNLSITGIDVFDSSFADRFWKSNTEDIFDTAAWSFNSVSEKFPNSDIYPTGYFVGGMAASYVATLAGIETNVFDGMSDIVIRSAYLTQASTIDADVFHGKNRPVVTNWYNGDSEYAKLFDFQANPFSADSRLSNSVGLRSNSGGKALELTCLFDQYPNGTFCVTDEESRTTVNGEPFIENIETNKATISSINKTVTSFFKNDPTLDLGFLKNGPRLVVGTTGDESVHSGRYDSLDQIDKKQIMYSGDGNDYFIGAEKSDVFVLGSGTTVVAGGAGADTYIVSGDARGEISDSMCGSALVFTDGLKDIMKGFIALSKGDAGSIDKFVASVDKIAEGVAESSDDTIVFRDCPLSEVKVVEDKSASLRGAYYVLQGGNASITVYKKGLFAKDFKIMGGDGESTELRSLAKGTYGAENGIRALAENNDSSNGVVTIETYVASGKLHLSSMNDGAIEELSFDDDFQYANDWCNFYYNNENQILSGAYDSDNLNVSFENSEIERIFLNMVKDDISDIQYADDITCSTVYVGVKDSNNVYLRTDGAEIEMLPVEPVLVDSVTLNKDSVTLVGASSDQLTATISPDDATDKNLIWESSDESVATVNERGNIKAVGKGSATITVTASNGITTTCAVTVSNPVAKLEISPSEVSVPRGSAIEVELIATGELPGEVDGFKNLAWSFENSDIASITQNGSKLLIAGNAVGSTAFAGSINIDNKDIRITGSVTVTKPAPGSIAISESEKTVNVIDDPFVLTASISPDDADYDSVEWASSDPNVVVVDADGTTVIKGVGSANITVKVGDKTAACVVTVAPYVISTTDDSALSASAEITKPALAQQLKELQLQIDKIDLASDGRFASLYEGFDGLHVGQYDIYFVDDEGNRVEWSSDESLAIKVSLLNDDLKTVNNKGTLSVHHIDDAFETKTDMQASIVGEELVFSTTHFSNYAVTAALNDNSGSIDHDGSNDDNGSNSSNDKGSSSGGNSGISAADDDAVNVGKGDLAATGDIAINALLSMVALIMACVAVFARQRSRKYASAKHRR